MLDYRACNYYQLTNTTAAEIFGIPANGTKIVLANPSHMISHGINSGLFEAIEASTVTVQDIRGNTVSSNRASGYFNYLESLVQQWKNDLSDAENYISAAYGKAIRLHWNLSAQHALMDAIGEDVLSTDFTNLGVTRTATIEKMEPVYSLVMQGMFAEAAALAATLATDGFFTTAKISQYQAVIAGADAFEVVL